MFDTNTAPMKAALTRRAKGAGLWTVVSFCASFAMT